MESTRQKMPQEVIHFLNNLSEILETKLLFFGSIQRKDYFPGHSDIDIDIFTDNVSSTISKMQHFFQLSRQKFKHVVWKLNKTNELVHGNKVMYKHPSGLFSIEFSIYNEKYKQGVMDEHVSKTNLPFYASWLLLLLKWVYYKLKLISKETFTFLKKKILSFMIGLPDDQFVVFEFKNNQNL